MDIIGHRGALLLFGGAVGYGLLVAWMVPPTRPHAAAPSWREHIKPIAPPAPVAFAGLPFVPGRPAARPQPVAYRADDTARPVDDEVTIYRESAPADQQPRQGLADSPDQNDQLAAAQLPPVDYRAGYRWAEGRGLGDPRDCRGAPSEAAEDGCLSYVYGDRPDRTARDEDSGPGPEDESDL